ncbi:MAG TPA: hypothetical protein VF590_14175 [Isosphaeraceae bacterium]
MSESGIRRFLLNAGVQRSSPYQSLADHGFSPEEVKATIIEVLEPYFEHREQLAAHAVEHLANEAINVVRLQRDPRYHETLEASLEIYRRAKASNAQRCFEIIGEWQAKILKGLSEYWSMYQLERDKSIFELEEFMSETARIIGGVIEAAIQPYVRELLGQAELIAGRDSTFSAIRVLDFGRCVVMLREASLLPHVCDPRPWAVSLNNWRNMAQHHDFQAQDGSIIGTYGKHPNYRTISLSRQEMLGAAEYFVQLLGALNVARAVFVFDNLDEARKFLPAIDMRPELKALHLSSAFATQGFVLEDLVVDDGSVRGVVRDATDGPLVGRSAHASQFVFAIWEAFPRDIVSLEYRTRDSSDGMLFESKGEVCRAIREGVLDPEVLAEKMKYSPL